MLTQKGYILGKMCLPLEMEEIMTMDNVCGYFKLEENRCLGKSYDGSFGQRFFHTFFSGKCTREGPEQIVSCYGMVELCQIPVK